MFWDDYGPYITHAFEVLCALIALVAGGIFVATLADNALNMGWGWDLSNLWIAPVAIVGAGVVQKIGAFIFRLVEAIAND